MVVTGVEMERDGTPDVLPWPEVGLGARAPMQYGSPARGASAVLCASHLLRRASSCVPCTSSCCGVLTAQAGSSPHQRVCTQHQRLHLLLTFCGPVHKHRAGKPCTKVQGWWRLVPFFTQVHSCGVSGLNAHICQSLVKTTYTTYTVRSPRGTAACELRWKAAGRP